LELQHREESEMINFLLQILSIDSTTGKEKDLAEYLVANAKPDEAEVDVHELENGQKNIFFKWGQPKIIFCTHLDTVPPYIPPRQDGKIIYGRGSCDAKGQIAVMYEVCKNLHQNHQTDFGLLLLASEETTSYGAKSANKIIHKCGCEYVIVGEPTENKLIQAAKGIYLFELIIRGKSAHSGYPEAGDSAVEHLRNFLNQLAKTKFPIDPILGKTTYNIAMLHSEPDAFNVIPAKITSKIFFRTTFRSHGKIVDKLKKLETANVECRPVHNSPPLKFHTVAGFESGTVSFGSDAPYLSALGRPLLYGAGSILTAHTLDEMVNIDDLYKARDDLTELYYKLFSLNGYELSPQR
jgi:acetylornithine deacetylase